MRFAWLLLVILAYPFTMVDPPACKGGGCAVNRDGSCAHPGDYMCGTISNPGTCTTVSGNQPGTFRCICQSMTSGPKTRH